MAAPQQSRDTIKVDTIYERELDPTLAKQALSAVSQKNAAAKIDVAAEERKKKLAAVQVNPADVLLLVEQLEISKAEADIAIRQADGDVSAAMAALVN